MQAGLFALLVLCALAGPAFAAEAAVRRSRWSLLVAAPIVVAAWWIAKGSLGSGDVAGLALTIAAATVLSLTWSRRRPLLAIAGIGIASGFFLSVLETQAIPLVVAVPLAIACPVVAWYCARVRPGFAPESMRDEALVLLTVIALCVAIWPGAAAGWRTATTLNVAAADVSDLTVPTWALAVSAVSLMLGGGYSVWRHR